jgi:hypothetical protein
MRIYLVTKTDLDPSSSQIFSSDSDVQDATFSKQCITPFDFCIELNYCELQTSCNFLLLRRKESETVKNIFLGNVFTDFFQYPGQF